MWSRRYDTMRCTRVGVLTVCCHENLSSLTFVVYQSNSATRPSVSRNPPSHWHCATTKTAALQVKNQNSQVLQYTIDISTLYSSLLLPVCGGENKIVVYLTIIFPLQFWLHSDRHSTSWQFLSSFEFGVTPDPLDSVVLRSLQKYLAHTVSAVLCRTESAVRWPFSRSILIISS